MLWIRRLVLALVLPLVLPACSSKPRAINDDPSVIQMRADFLQGHPTGKYNEYISKGEVVRGMNFVEVSASWGLPESRWKSRDRKFEYWSFFGKDEFSGNWSRYTLIFEGEILVDWMLDRHFTKNGTLTRLQRTGEGSNATPDMRVSSDGVGSSKK